MKKIKESVQKFCQGIKKFRETIRRFRLALIGRLTKPQKIILVVGLSVVLIVIIVLTALNTNLWQHWPRSWRARIALNKLGVSVYQEPICHEDCFYERQIYKKIIANNLGEVKFAAGVQKIILDLGKLKKPPDILRRYWVSKIEKSILRNLKRKKYQRKNLMILRKMMLLRNRKWQNC